MRLAILGSGAWGSALAISLGTAHQVRLWGRDRAQCLQVARSRVSPYLPDVPLPDVIRVEPELQAALHDAELVIVATATAGLRDTARSVARLAPGCGLLWACKGFETDTRSLPHQVVAEALSQTRVGALSGPSFALEVAQGLPTAVVAASTDAQFAASTATALNSRRLRIYSSDDLVGVELGGALKNVIAIAAGISDGLGLGRNARAALVTRGLAEITRLGVAMGGRAETFAGLTGLGDLVLTCTGELSRNRQVGVGLGRGERLESVLNELGHVSEGVASARAARDHAREHGVEMPITEAVCNVLFESLEPLGAVQQLLSRDPRSE